MCDLGHAGNACRKHMRQLNAKPIIPARRTDPPVRGDDDIDCDRYVARVWGT